MLFLRPGTMQDFWSFVLSADDFILKKTNIKLVQKALQCFLVIHMLYTLLITSLITYSLLLEGSG